jgi:hypothetical protein
MAQQKIVYAPGSPPLNLPPVREGVPVESSSVRFDKSKSWQGFFNFVYSAVLFLLAQPVLLSGILANRPAATTLPENSRYWSTSTNAEFIVIYATAGDPTTATWVAM